MLSKYLSNSEGRIIAILVVNIINFSLDNPSLFNVNFNLRIILISIPSNSTRIVRGSLSRIEIIREVKPRPTKAIKETLKSRYRPY